MYCAHSAINIEIYLKALSVKMKYNEDIGPRKKIPSPTNARTQSSRTYRLSHVNVIRVVALNPMELQFSKTFLLAKITNVINGFFIFLLYARRQLYLITQHNNLLQYSISTSIEINLLAPLTMVNIGSSTIFI